MKHPARILAGTALGLLMASSPTMAQSPAVTAPVLLAQADDAEARKLEEERAAREAAEGEAAPAEEEAAPAGETAPPAETEAPRQEAPAEAPTPEPAPAEAPARGGDAATEADDAAPQATEEPAAAEDAAPAAREAAPAAEGADPAAEEAAPAAEPSARERRERRENRAERRNRGGADAAGEAPADGDAPAATGEGAAGTDAAPSADAPRETEAERPADDVGDDAAEEVEATPADDAAQDAQTGGEDVLPENAAPVLDSAKERGGDAGSRRANRRDRNRAGGADEAAAEEAAPPPTSDEDAQAPEITAEEIKPITETEGRRVDREEARRERRQRPEGSEVVRESGGRVIFQFNNQTYVESNDLPRLSRDAREVYYEELPRGRVRETIVRPNGSQIVTVRNRHGEVVRRSRITPEGREIVLTYLGEENWDRERDWRDPGDELPPLRLGIPVREYILDAERVEDADTYYDFLDQPPVERARRLYSVDEVKRSARLRDTVRRVDLDTITFATGSAEITRSEVEELEGIADAILRLLEANPSETFLIEGHTDAVGSDISNLGLSDARAESAASALTQVFGIPPENLVTQGYGERYLKVATDGPSRENRRVAIRRITPLVTPVASSR